MKADWLKQTMSFPMNGIEVNLVGLQADTKICSQLYYEELQKLLKQSKVSRVCGAAVSHEA